MPPIINAQKISKAFGANPLFQNVSFTVSEGDRIGLIGLERLWQVDAAADSGRRREPGQRRNRARKRIRLSSVEQDSKFTPGARVRSVAQSAMERAAVPESDRGTRFAETLGRAGFEHLDAEASTLSGGWQKRLAIVEALVQGPDILLLDEPTNHLDLAGIEWLEALLAAAAFACVVVSHDRYFLENVATEMAELNRTYPDGLLRVSGSYTRFLDKKEEFLHAQSKRQEALENLVHREIEWLRRGAKARTRKSKARIDKAGELMGDSADLNARSRSGRNCANRLLRHRSKNQAADRTGRRLLRDGDRTLFAGLNCVITAGMRVGLVGPNGSGKTSLLRLLRGETAPTSGVDSPCRPAAHCVFRPEPRTRPRCYSSGIL